MTKTTYEIQYRHKSYRGNWIVKESDFTNLDDARIWMKRFRSKTHDFRLVRVEITEVE